MRKRLKDFIRVVVIVLAFFVSPHVMAQSQKVTGTIFDSRGEPIIGATIQVKENTKVGTITDFDGNFSLSVPSNKSILVVSYVGMTTKEVQVTNGNMRIVLNDDNKQLEEIVVVGYGQQKKASVVGAITQATGEVLQRAAGITDIGAALTGNLPGVITTTSSGMPGEEEPEIQIRGASSWNNSAPLVLVDGVERPMSSVEMSSVATISVLKDASATAVYGVKGANGVILITTKRGAEGKARISVSANAILKMPSKLPNKMDSYDALMARNSVIEQELGIKPGSWGDVSAQSFIENYRNQTTIEQMERYPNVDWQDYLFKKSTMSYNANLNVSGGTKFVKYYASVDFVNEGDLFRQFGNGRDYDSGYGYNRVNFRSNLDFNITNTTLLKVNLAGSNAVKKTPWENQNGDFWQNSQQWAGAYNIAPDVFMPKYSDGSWGFDPNHSNITNSASKVSLGGQNTETTTRITTDFALEQKLDFITKGLNARGMIAWDNTFRESARGVEDLYHDPIYKWINPHTGATVLKQDFEAYDKFDYSTGKLWNVQSGSVQDWATQRNLNYQLQLSWNRDFGKHHTSAMGLWGRQEYVQGSNIPSAREDWVFRVTYDWNNRYFFEYNGAYNGSEKFSKDNRFAFFQSGAIGWMISDEPFMKWLVDKKIVDMLKLRLSYGEIGDDNVGDRFLYMNQWEYLTGGVTTMDDTHSNNDGAASPYKWYRENVIGNPDIHWEKVKKTNLGIDYAFLGGLFAGTVEVFHDKRVDILVRGEDRGSIPSYFGARAPYANLGEVSTNGYELELRFNKVLRNKMRVWANMSMTHAKNEIKIKDDAPLLPDYQKQAGFSIGQNHAFIDKGFLNNYDELYGSPAYAANDGQKLPGDYYIVDFNGDGVIDNKDSAPYGYSNKPQNTYNATIGFEYKGFSCFMQWYGVTNVTRQVDLSSFAGLVNNVYNVGTWWATNASAAEIVTPRWQSTRQYVGTERYYDGSYIRLKNVEIAYTWTDGWVKKLGLNDLRLYLSANNLWQWSRMPDDREVNDNYAGNTGAYPMMKRLNLGIRFNL